MKERLISSDNLEKAADMLKAMAHPLRISIIELLQGSKQLNVTEIYENLGIEQAVASHHLSILKNKGVLESQRRGKSCYYFLKHERISQIVTCIEKCQDR